VFLLRLCADAQCLCLNRTQSSFSTERLLWTLLKCSMSVTRLHLNHHGKVSSARVCVNVEYPHVCGVADLGGGDGHGRTLLDAISAADPRAAQIPTGAVLLNRTPAAHIKGNSP